MQGGVRMWVSMYVCLSMHVCKYVMHLYIHACIAWMQTCKHIPVYTHSHMLTSHNIYICTHKWIHKGTRVGPHKYTYTYNTEHSKQVVCIHRGLCLHYRGCSIRPLCVNVVNLLCRLVDDPTWHLTVTDASFDRRRWSRECSGDRMMTFDDQMQFVAYGQTDSQTGRKADR